MLISSCLIKHLSFRSIWFTDYIILESPVLSLWLHNQIPVALKLYPRKTEDVNSLGNWNIWLSLDLDQRPFYRRCHLRRLFCWIFYPACVALGADILGNFYENEMRVENLIFVCPVSFKLRLFWLFYIYRDCFVPVL